MVSEDVMDVAVALPLVCGSPPPLCLHWTTVSSLLSAVTQARDAEQRQERQSSIRRIAIPLAASQRAAAA